MTLLGAIWYRVSGVYARRFRSAYYRQRLIRLEARQSREFTVGLDVTFNVPVRSGGAEPFELGTGIL